MVNEMWPLAKGRPQFDFQHLHAYYLNFSLLICKTATIKCLLHRVVVSTLKSVCAYNSKLKLCNYIKDSTNPFMKQNLQRIQYFRDEHSKLYSHVYTQAHLTYLIWRQTKFQNKFKMLLKILSHLQGFTFMSTQIKLSIQIVR